MHISLGKLRALIRESLDEAMGTIRGGLRTTKKGEKSGSGQKFKIGKTEDDNRELSTAEAEAMFPESTEAWTEIVPALFTDFPFKDDPIAVKRSTAWFKIGNELRAAFKSMPQIELAKWSPGKMDWVEMNAADGDVEGVTDIDDAGEDDYEKVMKQAYTGSLPRPADVTAAPPESLGDDDGDFDDLDSPLMKAFRKSGGEN